MARSVYLFDTLSTKVDSTSSQYKKQRSFTQRLFTEFDTLNIQRQGSKRQWMRGLTYNKGWICVKVQDSKELESRSYSWQLVLDSNSRSLSPSSYPVIC